MTLEHHHTYLVYIYVCVYIYMQHYAAVYIYNMINNICELKLKCILLILLLYNLYYMILQRGCPVFPS
jgi:hypothetical protein